jgi:hypothetical protein
MLARLPWQVHFPRSGIRHSVLVPLVLSLLVGILATIMGAGGGFVMLPMMVYLLGMPTHVAVGTSLFQILFLCAGVTYMQATTNQVVDLPLALALAVGSTIGAQVGARRSRHLRGEQLIILLATVVLLVVVKMTIGIISTPPNALTPTESASPQRVSQPVTGFPSHSAVCRPHLARWPDFRVVAVLPRRARMARLPMAALSSPEALATPMGAGVEKARGWDPRRAAC